MLNILLIIFLILLNGLFSMSEIALVSARKFKLEAASKSGSRSATKALELSANPNRFLSTVQIGITLIGIATGILSAEGLADRLTDSLSYSFPYIAEYSYSISVLLIVIVITFLSIVFGELLPKRIGLLFPETIAKTVAGPMHLISQIASPFIWLLSQTNDFFLRVFGMKDGLKEGVTEEEIRAIIQEGTTGGEIQEIEQDIVERVFVLGDRKVDELMTHRNDMVWFDIKDTAEDIGKKTEPEPHSVYPVADGSLDNLLGVVSAKDIFTRLGNAKFSLPDYVRKPLIVHENTPAFRLLEKFKKARLHTALVVDEYGSLQGIVSMDDVMDALLGDVSEYNQDEYKIIKRNDGSWLADGQFPYFEFLHFFELPNDDTEPDFNTIAGLILDAGGRIPAAGDKITWNNFTFEIMDMDGSRIDKVLITKTGASSEEKREQKQ
jgi:putative hemolysin